MVTVQDVIDWIPDALLIAGGVLLLGVLLGYLVARINRRLLVRAGVPEAVEGTAFERTVRSFGSSTVSIIASLSMWFIIGLAGLVAVTVADVRYTETFWASVSRFLPRLFVAILVLIIGVVIGDKIDLLISERLKGIKLPQVGVIPSVAKYSVVFIAILIALGQIGVATSALLLVFAAYVFAVIFLGGLATRDLLRSGAAGMYLLLNQPYGIGDEVEFGASSGIVQEVSIFVTRIEDDGAEYVIPNRRLFEDGFVRRRSD